MQFSSLSLHSSILEKPYSDNTNQNFRKHQNPFTSFLIQLKGKQFESGTMRNQCLRLLLLRCRNQSQPHVLQVRHFRSFTSSLLQPRVPHVTPKPLVTFRRFTSSPEVTDQSVILADIFARPGKSNEEIKVDLDSNNVVVTHDLVLGVLRDSDTSVEVARRVFNWVLECQSEKLSSKSYNYMLGVLGANGFAKECWDMIGVMKKKGYGVHKGTFARISEKFEKDGLSDDVERLKELYAMGSVSNRENESSESNPTEMACSKISKMIRSRVWGGELEKQLRDLGVGFSSDLVTMVLGNLQMEPNKALIFFRWIEESCLFKHDEKSYNMMAVVLSREESTEKFWRVVNEMRSKGHEMERGTYVKVLKQFVEGKLINDAVELYQFAMVGENKPSLQDCNFLLKKIVVSKELDMDLFLKVVHVFKASGNKLTNANLDAVLKSLTSVGRITECNRILEAMEEIGYLPDATSQHKIAFKLSSTGKKDEAIEFMENMAASRRNRDYGTWVSLVKGYCVARDLEEASRSFQEMVEDKGASSAGCALDLLTRTYCQKNKPFKAYKLISEMVKDKGLSPWCATYKVLTRKLLVKKRFKEALDVMEMMKNQGYAPDLDSFVGFLSKNGTTEDAVTVLHAMTSKKFPAQSVFLRLIDAYLKAGRRSEAQDFLAQCPSFIRNSADVLNLFCFKKHGDVAKSTAIAV